MYLLKRVKINGLWRSRNLDFELAEDINFLIGRNGSGKTALIRIVANTLAGNEELLKKEPFESIDLWLVDGKAKSVKISAKHTESRNVFGASPEILWQLDDQALKPDRFARLASPRRPSPIQEHLVEMVHLTWLSIDRETSEEPQKDIFGRPVSKALDGRVNELKRRLTRYFSEIRSSVDAQTQEFIRFVFVNLIPDLSSEARGRAVSLKEEKNIVEIYENFGIDDKQTKRRIQQFFEQLGRVTEAVSNESWKASDFKSTDLVAVIHATAIGAVTKRWQQFIQERDRIQDLQEKFLARINTLFVDKSIQINRANEPECILLDGATCSLTDLSSGEKQVLVILGEALLQHHEKSIYLADEPELSLHIEWQEQLVDAIREINPSAQIVFATHSPDIIGKYRSKVFDMAAHTNVAR